MATTRKTAAKKPATVVEPAPVAPAGDGVTGETVEPKPTGDAPAPVSPAGDGPTGEPTTDPKPEDVEAPVEPTVAATVEAPRQTPATASLEAPENRIPPGNGVKPTSVIKDSSGQLSVDMLTQGPAEIRSELYDAATKRPPAPEDVFDLEFPNGQSVVCQVRLCENLWITGQIEPMSRLVMAKGQRTDRNYAEQIIAILKQQIGEGASTGPLEV